MRHKVTRCHLAKAGHTVYHCGRSRLQKLSPSSHERWSDHLTILAHSDVNTGTEWMDVLLVLSSYCNPICLVAGRRGVRHQFDCVDFCALCFLSKVKRNVLMLKD